jgi:hypothetical protein
MSLQVSMRDKALPKENFNSLFGLQSIEDAEELLHLEIFLEGDLFLTTQKFPGDLHLGQVLRCYMHNISGPRREFCRRYLGTDEEFYFINNEGGELVRFVNNYFETKLALQSGCPAVYYTDHIVNDIQLESCGMTLLAAEGTQDGVYRIIHLETEEDFVRVTYEANSLPQLVTLARRTCEVFRHDQEYEMTLQEFGTYRS